MQRVPVASAPERPRQEGFWFKALLGNMVKTKTKGSLARWLGKEEKEENLLLLQRNLVWFLASCYSSQRYVNPVREDLMPSFGL